ncbi:MAG TPA: zf-HC2 domain-containing protein [Terriglobia bacterium]|nr:zf-HC2 domain-containing protein [Terriglobia bacterium]
MNCIEKGILRAKIDGELHGPELEQVDRHLASCADCRRVMEEISAAAGRIQRALEPLAPPPGELDGDARLALARFRAGGLPAESTEPAPGWFGRVFGQRWVLASCAGLAVGALAVSLSFRPVRGWAERVLEMLRVEKVEVVPVSTALPDIQTQERATKMLNQLISDNLVVTMAPGKPQDASSAEEASRLAGFHVRVPTARADAPHFDVEGEQAYHMTLNRDRLQSIFDELGRSDIQLPASVDGAEVAVHIPRGVLLRYGTTSDKQLLDSADQAAHAAASGDLSKASQIDLKNLLVLAEIPSPTVSVPPSLNLAQVAEAGLELAGLSPDEAHQYVQNIDWTSTLVIPVPREGGAFQKEPVDGVEGTLISTPAMGKRPASYSLIWIKNGIIYSLSGSGDAGDSLTLADSLQ